MKPQSFRELLGVISQCATYLFVATGTRVT